MHPSPLFADLLVVIGRQSISTSAIELEGAHRT
jgi:hypothetical protein